MNSYPSSVPLPSRLEKTRSEVPRIRVSRGSTEYKKRRGGEEGEKEGTREGQKGKEKEKKIGTSLTSRLSHLLEVSGCVEYRPMTVVVEMKNKWYLRSYNRSQDKPSSPTSEVAIN